MGKVFLQGTLVFVSGNNRVMVEVKDLYYDPDLKAFHYVDEVGVSQWILREHVFGFTEVR